MSPVFRVYTNPDILGVELGGSLKNVIALAAGAADGLGYGDNTKAALITRGIAEITRLGVAMGAKVETFNGLTGIGDLIVTCASRHSRNRKAGYLIGQGYTMDEAMKEVKMVVEGVYSAKAAMELAVKVSRWKCPLWSRSTKSSLRTRARRRLWPSSCSETKKWKTVLSSGRLKELKSPCPVYCYRMGDFFAKNSCFFDTEGV